jgi:membrane-bound lytic murein transglycosylase
VSATLKDKLNGNKNLSFVFFKETDGLSFRPQGASEFEL